jgi:hypothetical protein
MEKGIQNEGSGSEFQEANSWLVSFSGTTPDGGITSASVNPRFPVPL